MGMAATHDSDHFFPVGGQNDSVGNEFFQGQCVAFVHNKPFGFLYERLGAYDFDDLILKTHQVNKRRFLNTKAPFEKNAVIIINECMWHGISYRSCV